MTPDKYEPKGHVERKALKKRLSESLYQHAKNYETLSQQGFCPLMVLNKVHNSSQLFDIISHCSDRTTVPRNRSWLGLLVCHQFDT